jgi:hypothetical protein
MVSAYQSMTAPAEAEALRLAPAPEQKAPELTAATVGKL